MGHPLRRLLLALWRSGEVPADKIADVVLYSRTVARAILPIGAVAVVASDDLLGYTLASKRPGG